MNRSNKEPESNWPKIKDLLEQIICPANGWEDAALIATREEMGAHFIESYPDEPFTFEDLHLALHDLNIPYERNEHNNKFYYLASWR